MLVENKIYLDVVHCSLMCRFLYMYIKKEKKIN